MTANAKQVAQETRSLDASALHNQRVTKKVTSTLALQEVHYNAQGTYMICVHYHIQGNNCLFIFFLLYVYFITLTNSKVPAKEVVIVSFMLLLWLFSIYRCLCRIASDIILSPKLINPATQVTH